MIDGIQIVPLSPPSSPRMSAYNSTNTEIDWHDEDLKGVDYRSTQAALDMGLMQTDMTGLPLRFNERRPTLRTHKSFPYNFRPSGHSNYQAATPLHDSCNSPIPSGSERITISKIEDVEAAGLPQITFGGSAPASPISQPTPPSPGTDKAGDFDDGQDDAANSCTADEQEQKPLSAAELRAQKRKMKRFRLTHNQTRFLMSEFARQPHPDAAHRERLAREIPGLSPRQVQVWFQNRRAKLKRLTSDDRERMLRSRALPDDFDLTQALHSPYGTSTSIGTPLSSPGAYSSAFSEGSMLRPLTIDTLRRFSDGSQIPPAAISPSFSGYTFSSAQSATDTLSSVSCSTDASSFSYSPAAIDHGSRRSNPFGGSPTSTPGYTSHPVQRLQMHADRIGRTRAESLSSPLRSSITYTSASDLTSAGDAVGTSLDGAAHSSPMLPYGLGYAYAQIQGFQAGAASRMRSFSAAVPRRIELSPHYTQNRNATTPQTASYPNYTSSPLGASQGFPVPHLSAPHHVTTFQTPFMRQESGHTEQYPPVGSVLGELAENPNQDNDGSSGAQLPSSY